MERLIHGSASKPLEVEVMEQSERAVMPVPDTRAYRGQGQLASDQVSHACKITTKSGGDENPNIFG